MNTLNQLEKNYKIVPRSIMLARLLNKEMKFRH